MLMLGLYAHMLDIMSMVMLCSDLCVRMIFAMCLCLDLHPYMLDGLSGSWLCGYIRRP